MNNIKSIISLTASETQKIFKQKKYKIFLAVAALIIIGGGIFNMFPGRILNLAMPNYPYAVLSIICYVLAPLGIFMLSSAFLSGETASKEINVVLTRPVARYKVLLAKVAAIAGYIAILLVEGLILSSTLSIISSGITSVSISTVLSAYATGFIPLFTIIAMAVMIATLTKSETSCFTGCLLAYTGCLVLGIVFSGIYPALFTSYLGIGGMVIGSTVPFASFWLGVALTAGYALTFLSVSGLKFVSSDF